MTVAHAILRLTPRRQTLVLGAAALGAMLAYGMFLLALERGAAARLETLRRDDPAGYLEQIRKLEGFETYLALFADHYGFDQPRSVVPAFMVGRWTLRTQDERISARVRTQCSDPITFEYGLLEIPRDNLRARATYSIDGQDLIVAPATNDPFRVRLISYGVTIDHLELQPPGREQSLYAYPCAR